MMDFSGRPGLAIVLVLSLCCCCLVSASSPAVATSSSSSSSAIEQSPAVLLLQCTSIGAAYSSPPLSLSSSSSRACQALDDPSEVQVRLTVQLVTTTTATTGELLTFTGRCGPSGAGDEAGLLRARLPIGQGHHAAAGIAFNVSLLPSASSSLPAWAGEESSTWVDLSANQRRGVVVAHLPAGALAEGRLPGCYPLLSFRAALLHGEGEGEGGPTGAAAGPFSEGGEDSPLLSSSSSSSSSHSRRQSVTTQSVCDDREREVIGLASGLGVTGALLVCTLLGCFAIVGFQQYRLRNTVAGGGGGGGGGDGGYGGAKRAVQDYDEEDLDYGEGRRGGKGGVDRGRAATAARSMGRDVDVDVPELGHATSPRGARQVNKTADAMAHLREVDDDMEMQPTNSSNIPAPLW